MNRYLLSKRLNSHKGQVHGFTLIEFLVASALAVIVIMAATGTYFITRKLNDSAEQRVDFQRNLRNASSMLTRDARGAGAFGCFSTTVASSERFPLAEVGANGPFRSGGTGFYSSILDDGENGGYGVRIIPQNQSTNALTAFGANNITINSPILLFTYGKGYASVSGVKGLDALQLDRSYASDADVSQAIANKGQLVLSSCQNAVVVKPTGINGDIVNLSKGVDIPEIDSSNLNAATNLSVSRLYTSAYFVGTVNGQSSLLRYELGSDGTWQGPQLLSEGVSQMTVNFGYLKNCVAASSPAAASNIFTLKHSYDFSDDLSQKTLPAVIRISLTYDNDLSGSQARTEDFIINATVRSGNSCINSLI